MWPNLDNNVFNVCKITHNIVIKVNKEKIVLCMLNEVTITNRRKSEKYIYQRARDINNTITDYKSNERGVIYAELKPTI